MKEKTTNVVIFLIALFVVVGCAYDELGEIETNFRRTSSTGTTVGGDDHNPQSGTDLDSGFETDPATDGSDSDTNDTESADADGEVAESDSDNDSNGTTELWPSSGDGAEPVDSSETSGTGTDTDAAEPGDAEASVESDEAESTPTWGEV